MAHCPSRCRPRLCVDAPPQPTPGRAAFPRICFGATGLASCKCGTALLSPPLAEPCVEVAVTNTIAVPGWSWSWAAPGSVGSSSFSRSSASVAILTMARASRFSRSQSAAARVQEVAMMVAQQSCKAELLVHMHCNIHHGRNGAAVELYMQWPWRNQWFVLVMCKATQRHNPSPVCRHKQGKAKTGNSAAARIVNAPLLQMNKYSASTTPTPPISRYPWYPSAEPMEATRSGYVHLQQ